MKILAVDTSTSACSIAVWNDGACVSEYAEVELRHGNVLLDMIERCLHAAKITLHICDAFAFAAGPGSFTGLRISAGVIQGLALATHLPVIPISTLRAMAQRAWRELHASQVLVALDARQQEIYWGVYALEDAIMRPMQDDTLISPNQVAPLLKNVPWIGVGSAWRAYQIELFDRLGLTSAQIFPDLGPHAIDIAQLAVEEMHQGRVLPAEQALPNYLRTRVASKPPTS